MKERNPQEERAIAAETKEMLVRSFPGDAKFRNLTEFDILMIVQAFEEARKAFDEEKARRIRSEELRDGTERISGQETGWFPGDCCD